MKTKMKTKMNNNNNNNNNNNIDVFGDVFPSVPFCHAHQTNSTTMVVGKLAVLWVSKKLAILLIARVLPPPSLPKNHSPPLALRR